MPDPVQLKRFSAVVEAIYDCALDAQKWRQALPQIADLLESQSSTFAIHDMARSEGQRFFDYGIPEAEVRRYFETYAALNPLIPAITFMPVGEPWRLQDMVDQDEYRESRFYKEWAKPAQQSDLMGILALRAGSRVATHAVCRELAKPRYSRADVAVYGLLAPHICRSLAISDALNLKDVTAQTFENALEGLRAGVFLVSREGRVVHMNRSARDQIAAGRAVTVVAQRLTPVDADAARSLWQAVHDAWTDEAATPPGGHVIALPSRGDGGDPGLLASVLPLERGQRHDISRPFAAVAAVFVQNPEVTPPLPGEAFARLYKLTPGELRVLLAMMPGLQIPEIATVLGITATTVKTHLTRIYDKTGAKRQSDLVALVMRHVPPSG